MHSTQFTRLAQAADEFGFTIVAIVEMAPAEGTYPAARCILHDPDRPAARAYATSMGVLPDEGEAFFTSSHYDMSRSAALKLFADLDVAAEFRRASDDEQAIGVVA
jgi:hypothetical protein